MATMLLRRLGGRERRVAGVAVLVAVLSGVGFGWYWIEAKKSELEDELSEGQEAVEEIRERARDYLDSLRRKRALEEAIKENDAKIQTAIDALARKVPCTQVKGDAPAEATFDKVLRYEAKTTERPILLGEAAGKKKGSGAAKKKASDFVELSQPAEFGFVKFVDLVRFLEQVESPERLMYVSKLELTRKYGEADFVNGKLTVATFIYKSQKEEEETEE